MCSALYIVGGAAGRAVGVPVKPSLMLGGEHFRVVAGNLKAVSTHTHTHT